MENNLKSINIYLFKMFQLWMPGRLQGHLSGQVINVY